MTIIHSLTGHALVGSLSDELAKVRLMFERGPETPLNYAQEFVRELTQVRQKEIGVPTPAPQSGPSM